MPIANDSYKHIYEFTQALAPHTIVDDRIPRYHRLRDQLAARIAALEWQPHDPLPTEQELATAYGLAVGTVRKAVDLLEREGLVERFQGRGTFVRRATFDRSLFRFFRFHSPTGERRVPESRILERVVTRAPKAVIARFGLKAGAKAIRLARLRLIDSTPIVAEQIWLPYEPFAALAECELEAFGPLLYPFYEARCARVVARADERLTVESASEEDVATLQVPAHSPIVVIERVAFGYDGAPLEWRLSRGAAEHFSYEVEIR
ncbi:MAG: GntR family transcriptional regulator [Pseudomonadota bacterium]|jgi:GntR family transcriptional regulator|uniref:GntR family transcriptional regulator n=1 Tax=Burkholderiaceae TaxID=119060 RepID=UPI0010F9B17C|nr:GntR family transcriptional regulator [Burkholderia sp. 4M9327F10]